MRQSERRHRCGKVAQEPLLSERVKDRKNAQHTACQRNVNNKRRLKQDDAGSSSIFKILLTHDKMKTGSEGSWVILASVVAIWATVNCRKT